MTPALDVACGPRSFYFDKADERVTFCDLHPRHMTLCDGRALDVEPDVVADFRSIPFPDGSFSLVIFDPPHLDVGAGWLDVDITSRDTLERAVDKLMKAVYGERPFSPVRYSVRNLCGLGQVIADLIDPTCKNKEERTDNFICSACGETFCADPDGVNFPIDWAYCPNCGARVVREGDA